MKKTFLSTIISLSLFSQIAAADELSDGIKKAQKIWEQSKYIETEKSQKLAKLEECAAFAKTLAEKFTKQADGYIWQGICTASQAELLKLSALGKAKEAKAIFEEALTINDKALDGSAYTNLGVLYHRVPGWPIGFGDSELAEENFKKALAIAPRNIDANYFYALFLIGEDKVDEAKKHLEIAAKAPSRNRPLADKKRKEEIAKALENLQD